MILNQERLGIEGVKFWENPFKYKLVILVGKSFFKPNLHLGELKKWFIFLLSLFELSMITNVQKQEN